MKNNVLSESLDFTGGMNHKSKIMNVTINT